MGKGEDNAMLLQSRQMCCDQPHELAANAQMNNSGADGASVISRDSDGCWKLSSTFSESR